MTTYLNLDQAGSYNTLSALSKQPLILKQELTSSRLETFWVRKPFLSFCYAFSGVNEVILEGLQTLADDMKVIEKFQKLLQGTYINATEQRHIGHHALRHPEKNEINADVFRLKQWISSWDTLVSASGKPFKTVLQIGIGGSESGPKFLVEALRRKYPSRFDMRFLASMDGDASADCLGSLDFETTLFILTSKSGTTQETQVNFDQLCKRVTQKGIPLASFLKQQVISVSMPKGVLDKPDAFLQCFYLDESVGGRFSLTSTAGLLPVALLYGWPCAQDILDGAYEQDQLSLNPESKENSALMAALLTVWDVSFLNMPVMGLISYSEVLAYFGAYVQQLSCESNGKQVNIYNQPLNYPTGPLLIEGVGTQSQHSFFQNIHQGQHKVSLQCVGLANPQLEFDDALDLHRSLNTHLAAQLMAFAVGNEATVPSAYCQGNKPTSLVWLASLEARALGHLIAFYENKTMFEGFLWNINSFDQEGVQLGKTLAHSLTDSGKGTPLLKTFFEQL